MPSAFLIARRRCRSFPTLLRGCRLRSIRTGRRSFFEGSSGLGLLAGRLGAELVELAPERLIGPKRAQLDGRGRGPEDGGGVLDAQPFVADEHKCVALGGRDAGEDALDDARGLGGDGGRLGVGALGVRGVGPWVAREALGAAEARRAGVVDVNVSSDGVDPWQDGAA